MKSFEDAVDELKAIIDKLESGNVSLEESLTIFEKGVELITFCHKKLNEAQKRVQILVENADGHILPKDFDSEE
jgi:exodeoxyribonuclease VII small subunit